MAWTREPVSNGWLLIKSMEAENIGVIYLKCWRKKKRLLRILCPVKLYFKNEGKIKTFSREKLREFLADSLALLKMVKVVFSGWHSTWKLRYTQRNEEDNKWYVWGNIKCFFSNLNLLKDNWQVKFQSTTSRSKKWKKIIAQ